MMKIYKIYLVRKDFKEALVAAQDENEAWKLADLECLTFEQDDWEPCDVEEIGEAPNNS